MELRARTYQGRGANWHFLQKWQFGGVQILLSLPKLAWWSSGRGQAKESSSVVPGWLGVKLRASLAGWAWSSGPGGIKGEVRVGCELAFAREIAILVCPNFTVIANFGLVELRARWSQWRGAYWVRIGIC